MVEYFKNKPERDFPVWDNGLKREAAEKWGRYTDFSGVDTIVVKVGTNIITHKEDPRRMHHAMRCIADDIRSLLAEGYDVKLVTSGACGLGRDYRKEVLEEIIPEDESESPAQQQRDAKHGQSILMRLWAAHFYPQKVEESLLIHADIGDLARRQNLLQQYREWYEQGILPVINEDDARSTEELPDPKKKYFRDNDELASLIARYLNRRNNVLLVIFTDADGVYLKDSYLNGQKEVISVVKDATELESQAVEKKPDEILRRGGIVSKIMAARDAAKEGVRVIIASGEYWKFDIQFQERVAGAARYYDPLHAILEGKVVGTRFIPRN